MGNPPNSQLLEHVPAMAVMLDCLGHVFPFISPGTKMDVGQALQPGETPLCAAQNTCPAVSWHLQSLPGQGEAPCLPPSHRLPGPKRSKSRWNLGTSVYWEICHPKLHFVTRNQIRSCWHGRKLAINILVWILCARYPQLWALSDEGGENTTLWYTNKYLSSVLLLHQHMTTKLLLNVVAKK